MSMVHKGGVVGVLAAVVIGAAVSMAGPAAAHSEGPARGAQGTAESPQSQHQDTSVQDGRSVEGNWQPGRGAVDGWKSPGEPG